MTKVHWAALSKIALSVAIAVAAVPALAQNTTSAVAGRITGTDGKPASGAQVTILHKESGSVTTTVTDAEGRYGARGLRVGGPYTITITKAGVTEKREGVYLQLAETASIDAKLGGATQSVDTIVVTGQNAGSDKFSNTAMGAGTSIGRAELDAFASIQRNLQDYARIDPRVAQTDKQRGEVSVAGQNSRYNSITIDSVAINDTFGLESNGLPTLKQPISIDAIQSVQVNVSNYDVTQKGYTGANVNAITKSGTNELHGSASYVYRDDKWVGQRYNRTTNTYVDAPKFEETTMGFTLGGPIIKDKLFFFVGYEELKSTRNAPAFGPIGSSGLENIGITSSAIASAQSLAKGTYNIDIGSSDIPSGTELSAKDTLVKLDWNINASHRASLRYAKTEQKEPIFPNFFNTPSTALSLSSNWYNQNKTIETVVGQVFSDWTPTFSTELKVSNRDYHSEPKNNSSLPQISLSFTGALPTGTPAGVLGGTRNLLFGTERSRHTNILDTKTLDGYLGANWTLGEHELKFAADYSENKIYNAFLQDTKGNYTFNCQNSSATYTYSFGAINCGTATAAQIEAAVLENFRIGRPTSFSVQVPLTAGGSLADGIASFKLKNYGSAVQDTWTVNPNLTVMYGVRLDTPATSDKPKANIAAAAPVVAGNPTTGVRQSGGFGLDNTKTIDGEYLLQPRAGFNYTFDSPRPMQLRGGFGLFQGAAATVWLSNPFSNPGVATGFVGCGSNGNPACPAVGGTFRADPAAQLTSLGAAPAPNVDYIQEGLGQPAVWKANLAFEHELPWYGIVAGVEYLYTKTETGIYYQHLNLGAPTFTGFDGRASFYTASARNPACWTAGGARITTGTVCSVDNRNRALSNARYNNVLIASKTNEGRGNLATFSLSRPMKNNWAWSFSYTYTDATEVSGLTSSLGLSRQGSLQRDPELEAQLLPGLQNGSRILC
ncbi:MAG: TonB-dependent receptor [Usitatibacteraceae bacterium]